MRTSLSGAQAIVQVADEKGGKIEGIEDQYIGGTDWTKAKIEFNSGDHDKITIGVLKYEEKEESKTKLENLIKNSDLIGITQDSIKGNNGWPLGWNSGDFYSNAPADNPVTIGEGYGENANGFVLPAENGDVWVRTAAQVKPNTEYIFKVRVKHSAAQAGTTVSVEGPNNDENA